MSKKSSTLRAFIHHYDEKGERTKPAERVFCLLCTGMNPQVLSITLPNGSSSISITRAELERVLKNHPKGKKQ